MVEHDGLVLDIRLGVLLWSIQRTPPVRRDYERMELLAEHMQAQDKAKVNGSNSS